MSDVQGFDPADTDVLRALFLHEVGNYLERIFDAATHLEHAARSKEVLPADEIDALFRGLHTLKGAAGSVGHEAIARAAHDLEDICVDLRQGRLVLTPGILERLQEDLSALRALVDGARRQPRANPEGHKAHGPAPLIERRQSGGKRIVGDRRGRDDSVQVESRTLDDMQERTGDLVITRTRIERRALELRAVRDALLSLTADAAAPALKEPARALAERLDETLRGLAEETESLRRIAQAFSDSVCRARLVRLDWIYHRLGAALREAEAASGKRAQLITTGGLLELDKNVLEQLYPLLLHLLRNAIAHGIEEPALRRRAGKPEVGRIEISVRIEHDFVSLSFSDDGSGVDRERARQALIEQGRLLPDAPFDDTRLMAALFEVGFSTRRHADILAGRGMGLDVVRNTVLALGGDVSCETARGHGTRFDISFPLTTAITEALLMKVGGQVYALPQPHVAEESQGASTTPRVSLLELFGAPSGKETPRDIVCARFGSRRFDLECERVIGPRIIVVRPLGPILGRIPYFSGATISGSGKAQLVLNARTLADLAYRQLTPSPIEP